MNEMSRAAPAGSPRSSVSRAAVAERSAKLAPDCRGLNFFEIDHGLRSLLPLYMDSALLAHLQPHLRELGELAGGRLLELSEAAERHPPVLHARDRSGRDEEWIEFHPSYRGMEEIAFGRFGMHAMMHGPAYSAGRKSCRRSPPTFFTTCSPRPNSGCSARST